MQRGMAAGSSAAGSRRYFIIRNGVIIIRNSVIIISNNVIIPSNNVITISHNAIHYFYIVTLVVWGV